METVLFIVLAVSFMALAGVVILAYVMWRDRRRDQDALNEAFAEFTDQEAQRGGGGPTPIR